MIKYVLFNGEEFTKEAEYEKELGILKEKTIQEFSEEDSGHYQINHYLQEFAPGLFVLQDYIVEVATGGYTGFRVRISVKNTSFECDEAYIGLEYRRPIPSDTKIKDLPDFIWSALAYFRTLAPEYIDRVRKVLKKKNADF